MVGVRAFTFEELICLLTQVEAFLNSRTLAALSNDPNDLACLSPGHFLVVARLSCFSGPKLSALSVTCLGGSICSGSYKLLW